MHSNGHEVVGYFTEANPAKEKHDHYQGAVCFKKNMGTDKESTEEVPRWNKEQQQQHDQADGLSFPSKVAPVASDEAAPAFAIEDENLERGCTCELWAS